jgi:hypothetical protein
MATLAWTGPVAAQTVPKAPAAKPAEPMGPSASDLFAAGTKAFEQGKTDQAIAALSTAINTGKLAPPQLAKALFYRGVAYRKQAKPGQALSDLTAAVWLRGGLSDADRVVAEDHRRSLQREVGLPTGPAPGAAVVATSPPVPPVASNPPAPVPTYPVAAAPAPVAASTPWTSQATAEGAAEAAPTAVAVTAPTPPVAPPVAIAAVAPTPVAVPAAAAPADAPLPWGVAADAPPAAQPDAAPPSASATVAPVERAALAPVDAAPAPPSKPLPWQIAAAPINPPPSQPVPWATTAASSPPPPEVVPSPPPAAVAPAPPPEVVAAPPPVAPTVSPATMLSDAGKAASTLFGGLFTGGAAPAPAPASIETAALAQTAPPKPATPPDSGWSAPAVVARTLPPDPPAPSAEPPPAAPVVVAAAPAPTIPTPPAATVATVAVPAAPPPKPGNFKLQVAAAQTRAEAEEAMQRLVVKHTSTLRGASPQIEDPPSGSASIFGSMGPAYRVSVGPYMTAVEPGRLCNILRPHGFDCKVVAIETPAAN